MAPAGKQAHILALFDVDGTLTKPRGEAMQEMLDMLAHLRGKITTGVVGGSDMPQQMRQLGPRPLELFDYNFAENGLNAYKNGEPMAQRSVTEHLGEATVQRLINWMTEYLLQVTLPFKCGTSFVEIRVGMLNINPIGRPDLSTEERNGFQQYDIVNNVRQRMIQEMKVAFADLNLAFSVGGQVTIDVFPQGWDKTYCLQFLPEAEFTEVHFFGDKTDPGGNDHEIYQHPRTIGHKVTSPEHTMQICEELWGK